MDNSWRIIDTGLCSAAFNMALDEAIAAIVRRGLSAPTLRLYGWKQRSVSIGCFQKSADINIDYCRENAIPIVRRPTGGRAVCHHDEITYSFSTQTKTGPFSHGLFDSYRKISVALTDALSLLGVTTQTETRKRKSKISGTNTTIHNPLCFLSVSYGEISVDETKVIGSAQKRWTDGLLQQGSILLTVDEEIIFRLFHYPVREMTKEPLRGLRQLVPSLSDDLLKKAMQTAFEETFHIKFIRADPVKEEIALARDLESRKYLNDAWTFRR